MTLFWVIGAAFILFALAFILPPILQRSDESERESEDERRNANIAVYRDQLAELEADLRNGITSPEQYAQDREEIERRLLDDTSTSKTKTKTVAVGARSTAYAIAFALPVAAIVFYLNVGNPKAITNEAAPTTMPSRAMGSAPTERTQEQIEANVAALAKRLQENPNDAQGWTMLARSYNSMERFGEAAGAYAKATELSPKDADLWAEFAFVTAMASGRSLEGRPKELIDKALQVDPQNAKALQLAGSAAFQAKDYKKAVGYWERVLKQVPPKSEVAEQITARINEAKTLAAGTNR
ncbi:MAG TPA: c-type cytochrome biogenesis protein CcmI [Pyrinomonadaceae bacterium]|nr:c-type cytochrome biogenesis protein CcmI [Pyrinomonadaceae bacterium]